MEAPARESIIIEFNGLPGCGKSTIARALKNSLLNKTSHVCSFSYYKKNFFKNKIVQLFWYKNARLLYRLLRLALMQKDFFASLPGILAICRYNQMYYMFSKNEGDVLIIDQGLVQGFLSMSHTNYFAKSQLINQIARCLYFKNFKFVMVNCDITVEGSLNRIKRRNAKSGRLDIMNDSELKKVLKVQESNLRLIRNRISSNLSLTSITISTHDCIEDNVEKILKIHDNIQ